MLDVLLLIEEIRFLVDQTPMVSRPPVVGGSDKWIIRSALQKALRRGLKDKSLGLALSLHDIDSPYFWHSLAVIMVEDIGYGWIDGLTYTTACTLKTVRQQATKGLAGGEQHLLTALVERMCAAPKHRGCCELSLAVEYGQRSLLLEMDRWPTAKLVDAVDSDDASVSYAGLLILKGLSRGLLRRPRDPLGLEQAEEIINHRLQDNPTQARAAIHCLRRPSDSMSLAVLPVFNLINDQAQPPPSVLDERPLWPESEIIAGQASEAFDVHTRDGKIALKAFHTSLAKRHEVAREIDPLRAVKALGATVFIVEGALVDQRIVGPQLADLRAAQDNAFMTGEGVPEGVVVQVRELVRANIGLLNAKRRWVLGETR